MSEKCYYYAYHVKNSNVITLIWIQWFDLDDYEKDRFIYDEEDGSKIHFEEEEEGIKWLNHHLKPEYIDKEYLRLGSHWSIFK